MALWLCRAGKLGEYETRFQEDNRIYCTWYALDWDMSQYSTRQELEEKLKEQYPDEKAKTVGNWTSQLWAFSHKMQVGDLVALPSKIKPSVYIGEIRSDYINDPDAEAMFWQYREVHWIEEVNKSEIDQDLLYSLGAFSTICQIQRNDAENRIRALLNGQTVSVNADEGNSTDDVPVDETGIDIEEQALEEIAEQIIRKFKGNGLEKIVAAILEAQGFTTYCHEAGPDHGVDILAAKGSLGFGSPKICVQVKSQSDPVDRPVHDQLLGTMANHNADYGMLVSWGGFKNSILKETAKNFFKVRLWTHKEVVQEFLKYYDKMPEEIQEAIPLKQVWIYDRQSE
jgi:restriction system protein